MKWKMLAICLLLMAALIPMSVQAEYVVTPMGGAAMLRKSPTTDADICGTVDNGATVTVLDTIGLWAKVDTGDDIAWLQTRYLSDEPGARDWSSLFHQEPESVAEVDYSSFKSVEPYIAYIQAPAVGSFVNLRWAPSRAAALQARVSDNVEVVVLAEGDGWAQVEVGDYGYTGFVQSMYLLASAEAEAGEP